MKSKLLMLFLCVSLWAVCSASSLEAKSKTHFSINFNSMACAPAPVCMPPQPVYVAPAPVQMMPRPMPVGPRPVYVQPGYAAYPVVYEAPAPVVYYAPCPPPRPAPVAGFSFSFGKLWR